MVSALVFVAAVPVLVSRATASEPVSVTEVTVLAVGLTLMLVVNALLVRASLRPLDGHTALMKRIDLRRRRKRAQESLTNIARHADASRVELSLTGSGKMWCSASPTTDEQSADWGQAPAPGHARTRNPHRRPPDA